MCAPSVRVTVRGMVSVLVLVSLLSALLCPSPASAAKPKARKSRRARRQRQEGDIRLVGGKYASSGTVMLYHDGKWGAVCDDMWDDVDSDVVCRQKGFPGSARPALKMEFGRRRRRLWISKVQCQGTETRLLQCDFAGWGWRIRRSCPGLWRAVGVVCKPRVKVRRASRRKALANRTRKARRREKRRRTAKARKAAAARRRMLQSLKRNSTTTATSHRLLKKRKHPEVGEGPVFLRPSAMRESSAELEAELRRLGRRRRPVSRGTTSRPTSSTPVTTTTASGTTTTTTTTKPTTTTMTIQPSTTTTEPTTTTTQTTSTSSTTSSTQTSTSSTTTPTTTPQTSAPSTTTQTTTTQTSTSSTITPTTPTQTSKPSTTTTTTTTQTSTSSTTTPTTTTQTSTSSTTTPTTTTQTSKPSTTTSTESSTTATTSSTQPTTTTTETTTTTPQTTTTTTEPTTATTTTPLPTSTSTVSTTVPTSTVASTTAPPETTTTSTTTTSSTPSSAPTKPPKIPGPTSKAPKQTTTTESSPTTNLATSGDDDVPPKKPIPEKRDGSVGKDTEGSVVDLSKVKSSGQITLQDKAEEGEDDVLLQADSPRNPDLELRLDGGRYPWEGLLEVREKEAAARGWGTICGSGWSIRETMVVCRELGLNHAKQALQTNYFGGHDKVKSYLSVNCTGREAKLSDCQLTKMSEDSQCPKKTLVAGVVCSTYLPDLVPNLRALSDSVRLQDRPLYYLQCALEENCLSSSAYELKNNSRNWRNSMRRLLRFSTIVHNRGTADFRPYVAKGQWEWHTCHMHFHSMEVFAHYDIMDVNGTRLAEGSKASFCLEDTVCDRGVSRQFLCAGFGDQGLSVNCSDNYMWDIDCQWIDITDIEPGKYTFLMEINPELRVAELDYDNNVARCELWYSGYNAKLNDCRYESLLDYRR